MKLARVATAGLDDHVNSNNRCARFYGSALFMRSQVCGTDGTRLSEARLFVLLSLRGVDLVNGGCFPMLLLRLRVGFFPLVFLPCLCSSHQVVHFHLFFSWGFCFFCRLLTSPFRFTGGVVDSSSCTTSFLIFAILSFFCHFLVFPLADGK